MLETTLNYFAKISRIIVFLIAKFKLAILRAIRGAVSKNYHGTNDVSTGLVRNIVALNALRWIRQIK